jgi:nucleoside-diphosphate-sugar epimerase
MNDIIKEDLKIICSSNLDWEKFKNSVVLISGAYGMLPSYMVFTLLYLNKMYPGLNIKVIALGRNYDKAKKRFCDFLDNPLLTIVSGDVSNKIEIKGDVNYIIHAASPASSQFYGIDPIGVISPNVFGTKNLLELAVEKKSKGFLFFSSGEVCGTLDKKAITEEDSGYSDPTDLRNCYGESKRMAENMCKCWHHQYKVPTLAVRPDHTYGPTMDLENDRRVFAEFVSDVVNNRNIVVKSDGLSVRTFCYISDGTDGFFRVLLNGTPGESYNVSNNEGQISIGNLANLIVSLFPEKKLKVVYANRENKNSYLENKHKMRPMLSTAKIEKLDYKCRFKLRDGFYRTIKSFLKEENEKS